MTASAITDHTAVVVLSDPDGGDEALGRTFNALALARDLDQAGQDVQVIFQGAGTRWPGRLADPTHPVNGLFEAVRHTIAGASCGCAQLFGAQQDVTACGIKLLTDNQVPGTDGVAGLRSLIEDGRRVLIF